MLRTDLRDHAHYSYLADHLCGRAMSFDPDLCSHAMGLVLLQVEREGRVHSARSARRKPH